jgi:hypothetical protein
MEAIEKKPLIEALFIQQNGSVNSFKAEFFSITILRRNKRTLAYMSKKGRNHSELIPITLNRNNKLFYLGIEFKIRVDELNNRNKGLFLTVRNN